MISEKVKITNKEKIRTHWKYVLSCGHFAETFANHNIGDKVNCLVCYMINLQDESECLEIESQQE